MAETLLGTVERFDRAVSAVDTDTAVALVEGLLERGIDAVTVLMDVVAAVQRRVGTRWVSGEWSVAEEHAATTVAVSAVEAVGRHVRRTPATGGRVLVACAEHEWHALPAMIVGTALRSAGWHVTVLGASTPTMRLSRFLQDLGPDLTAVSCSVLAGLPASRRFVEASTAAGIPVLAGGAAFGPDARRAEALGATAWAPDARAAVTAAAGLPSVVPAVAPLPTEAAAELAAIELANIELLASLTAAWSLAGEPAGGASALDGLEAVGAEVVNHSVHAVAAALMTGDPRPLGETADWATALLRARGVGDRQVARLGRLLAAELTEFPIAQRLVQEHWGAVPLG